MLNLDKLTYAGNLHNLASLEGDARHVFVQGDIGDRPWWKACWPATSPRHCQLCRRKPRGPLHPRPRGLHPDQRRRQLQALEAVALLEALPATEKKRFAFCM